MEDFTSRPLSLHQTTLRDATPAEVVRIAAALGCRHVCLFTQSPGGLSPFPIVQDHEVDELRRLMDGEGVSILSATSFTLTPEATAAGFAAGLAMAQRLGGAIANVRIRDDDQARATDNFARLGALAQGHGIELSIEFMGFDAPHLLDQTLEIIRQAGCGKVSLDPLHIVRSGTPMAAVKKLGPDLIGYVQLCDGPMAGTRDGYLKEAAYSRLPPGQGEFPLLGLLDATPPGTPLALEVPQEDLLQWGASILDRARLAVDGARSLLERASQR